MSCTAFLLSCYLLAWVDRHVDSHHGSRLDSNLFSMVSCAISRDHNLERAKEERERAREEHR